MHENAHVEALLEMDKELTSTLERLKNKYNLDEKSFKRESKIGKQYARDMGDSYRGLMGVHFNEGIQAMERNESLRKWVEKYASQFKNLSETAQVVATYAFLRGYKTMSDKVSTKMSSRFAPHIPPTSSSKNEHSLLHAKTLKKFFSKYNNEVQNRKSLKEIGKLPQYKSIVDTIERICG